MYTGWVDRCAGFSGTSTGVGLLPKRVLREAKREVLVRNVKVNRGFKAGFSLFYYF